MKTDSTLLRLRQANPVPQPTPLDGSDLFARITALPQDSRTRHRSSPRGRRGLALAIALLVAALLASTAYSISTWVFSSAVGPDVTQREYRAAQHELRLPPGYRWPARHFDANSVTSGGAGGGTAVFIAQNDWECYWVKAIRSGDVPAQRRAHAELQSLLDHNILVAPVGAPEDWTPTDPPKGPYARFAHDGGLGWVRKGYALAAAGHPQRLAQSCQANR